MKEYKKCITCNLPENFPGISFDEKGECCFCKKQEVEWHEYKGMDALKARIQEVIDNYPVKDRQYDAVVGYSGGRDSTYLLYMLKNVLNLRVLAVSLSHDFMPEQTKHNIKDVADKLGVEVAFIENDILNKYGRKSVQAWAKKPNAPMLMTFCTGCRYGIKKLIPEYARAHNIPMLFVGDTPMEYMSYRVSIVCANPNKPTSVSKVMGYGKHLLKNPALMVSPKCLSVQAQEFLIDAGRNKQKKNPNPVTIRPFFDYVPWKEQDVLSTIESLGWKHDESLNSSWRSDCYINMLRQYYYRRILGFADLELYYARLIHQGKITKEEAIERIKKESNYPPEVLSEVLHDIYNLDFNEIEAKIKKAEEKCEK